MRPVADSLSSSERKMVFGKEFPLIRLRYLQQAVPLSTVHRWLGDPDSKEVSKSDIGFVVDDVLVVLEVSVWGPQLRSVAVGLGKVSDTATDLWCWAS